MSDLLTKTSLSSGGVRVVEVTNPLCPGGDGKTVRHEEPLIGGRVIDYITESQRAEQDLRVSLNGQYVERDRWCSRFVSDGDTIVIGRRPSDPVTALFVASLVISISSPFIARALIDEPSPPDARKSSHYSGGAITTTADPNIPVPILYGEFVVGGNVIHSTTRHYQGGAVNTPPGGKNGQFSSSAGLFRQLTVIGVAEGVLEEIAGYTADADELWLPKNRLQGPGSAPFIGDGIKINGNNLEDWAEEGFVSLRLGRNWQDALPNLPGQIKTFEKGTDLEYNKEQTYVTSGPIDAFSIVFFFPQGYYWTDRQGNRKAVEPAVQVRWRPEGSSQWSETQVVREGIQFESSSGWSIRRNLPALAPVSSQPGPRDRKIEIGITLLFPDKNWQEKVTGTLQWASVQEITIGGAPIYPLTGIVMIDASVAAMTSEINRATIRAKGRRVWVFDENDPTAPPVKAWSRLNADIALDYILSRVGARDRFTLANVDLPAFMEWKKKNKQQIADGAGGFINRHEFNGILDVERGWKDHLASIFGAGRAKAIWSGSKVRPKFLEPADPVQPFSIYGLGNIEKGSFRYQPRSTKNEPNQVVVRYRDRDLDYAEATQASDESEDGTIPESLRPKEIEGIGISHRVHARNHASFARKSIALPSEIEFVAGIDAIAHEIGDTISVQHTMMDWGGISGLVLSTPGANSIQLDQDVDIPAGVGEPFWISVLTTGTGAEVHQLRQIVAPPGTYLRGTQIQTSPNWDVGDHPQEGDVYCAGLRVSQEPSIPRGPYKLYIVESMTTAGDFKRRIKAVEYDPALYRDPFPPPPAPPRPRVVGPGDIPPPVRNLTLRQDSIPLSASLATGNSTVVRVTWSNQRWTLPYRCRIYARVDTFSPLFRYIDTTEELAESYIFRNVLEGYDYTVAVVPVSNDGANWHSAEKAGQARASIRIKRPVGLIPPNLYPKRGP